MATMTFYRLSFIKLLGTIIISMLIVYSFFNDINNSNKRISKIETISLPEDQTAVKKIDVGYGDDYWILTENNQVIVYFLCFQVINIKFKLYQLMYHLIFLNSFIIKV